MPLTHFPNGLSSFGVPVLPSFDPISIPNGSGSTWFVDTNYGSNGNSGENPDEAFKTITKAISQCVGGAGDTIFVFPGTYNENVTCDKADVSIIAAMVFGNAKRVAIAPTTGIACYVKTGAIRFYAKGIRFVGTSNVGFQLAADGALFEKCDFTSDTSHGFVFEGQTVDLANTGSGTEFNACIFRECGDNGIHMGAGAGTTLFATNVNLFNSQFYLNTNADIADQAEGTGQKYWNQWNIVGCQFMNQSKAVYLSMKGGGGADGDQCSIAGNFFADNAGLDSTKIAIPSGATFPGNFDAKGVVDGSGF